MGNKRNRDWTYTRKFVLGLIDFYKEAYHGTMPRIRRSLLKAELGDWWAIVLQYIYIYTRNLTNSLCFNLFATEVASNLQWCNCVTDHSNLMNFLSCLIPIWCTARFPYPHCWGIPLLRKMHSICTAPSPPFHTSYPLTFAHLHSISVPGCNFLSWRLWPLCNLQLQSFPLSWVCLTRCAARDLLAIACHSRIARVEASRTINVMSVNDAFACRHIVSA